MVLLFTKYCYIAYSAYEIEEDDHATLDPAEAKSNNSSAYRN